MSLHETIWVNELTTCFLIICFLIELNPLSIRLPDSDLSSISLLSQLGTIESTGQSVQARTSYLPSEILWGERFVPVLQSDNEDAEFLVNFSMFNMTRKQSMPSISSREYQIRKKFHKLIQFKKYLSKLSDADINAHDEQPNVDTNTTNNLNLLRHLINQNDKHSLNGLITNMDDLNALNNLLNTLNKLVNSGGSSSNSANGNCNGSLFNSKNLSFSNNSCSQNANQLNVGTTISNLSPFYQQSLSVDQAARKKSTDISNLLDLLQNAHVHSRNDPRSKSINFLNNLNSNLSNSQMSHSMNNNISTNLSNNQINQANNQLSSCTKNSTNPLSNQQADYSSANKMPTTISCTPIRRNNSEHITIEDDLMKISDTERSVERKKSGLKLELLSLFQPSLDSQLVTPDPIYYNSSTYNDANYHATNTNNQQLIEKANQLVNLSNQSNQPSTNHYVKSNQANRKLKDPNSKLKAPKYIGKSETYLPGSTARSSNGLMNNFPSLDWKSRSDWNITVPASRKRQFFKSKK